MQPAASSSKADLSLPAKPSSSSAQNAASLSYSAQIAQQFSAYQQTPSQERQQRQHGSSAQTFVPPKTSPIATVDSSASDSDTVFGKKPSEMHDAGWVFFCVYHGTCHSPNRKKLLLWYLCLSTEKAATLHLYISPITRLTVCFTVLHTNLDITTSLSSLALGTRPYYSYDFVMLLRSLVHLTSKLFIGGLNWDTTDGILFSTYHLRYLSLIVIILPFYLISSPRAEGLRNYFSQFGKVAQLWSLRLSASLVCLALIHVFTRSMLALSCEILQELHEGLRFWLLKIQTRYMLLLLGSIPLTVNPWVPSAQRMHTLLHDLCIQIDPKRAIPREEHLRNTRYFVGGLAPATSSESMKEFFSAYGKVVDATVMLDRESGRSKGFGFVTFEDAANADQLVGKNLILDEKQACVPCIYRRNWTNGGLSLDRSQNGSASKPARPKS